MLARMTKKTIVIMAKVREEKAIKSGNKMKIEYQSTIEYVCREALPKASDRTSIDVRNYFRSKLKISPDDRDFIKMNIASSNLKNNKTKAVVNLS